MQRLKELYLNELITLDEYKQDKAQLSEKLETLKAQSVPKYAPLQAFKGVNIAELYQTLTPQERRRFWRAVVVRVHFNAARELRIDYR